MRPSSRSCLSLTQSVFSGGPLVGKFPIGRFAEVGPTSSRLYSVVTKQATCKATRVKRWQATTQRFAEGRQIGSGFRNKSSWEKAQGGAAETPKRADTKPLLGALFGVTAVAYIGSSLISHDSDVEENPIKSTDGVDITDADGKS